MNQPQVPSSAFIDPRGGNKAEIDQLAKQVLGLLLNHLQTASASSPLPQITQLPFSIGIPDRPISESEILEQLQTILANSMNAVNPAFIGHMDSIKAAFDAPHLAEPGTRWVYRTSDTFILTRALHNYLQTQEGPEADIYQFVVDEIYIPLGLGPGAYTTMRTADNDWQGQAEGGYGQWWIPDDIAKIGTFLIAEGGQINGEQSLHPGLLAAAMQKDTDERGVKIDSQRMYNNSFWANYYTPSNAYDCEFWVPQMLGVSGNVVALFPNGITYYYFSDNRDFTWEAALKETDKILTLCP